MGIKRFVADKDATITDAFKENLTTRASEANMGASDVLEVFSIFGQAESTPTTLGDDTYDLENRFESSSSGFGANISRFDDKVFVTSAETIFSRSQAGAVYIYNSSSTGWEFEQKITSSTPEVNARFGEKTQGYEGHVLVSSAFTTAVDGTGSVEDFASGSNGWVSTQKFSGSALTASSSHFGASMDLESTTMKLLVGGYGSDRAFVFKSGSAGWTEEAALSGSLVAGPLAFGFNLAISGAYAAIGSGFDNKYFAYAGAGYVFKSGSTGWLEEAHITSSDLAAYDYFGAGIDIDKGKIVITSFGDASAAGAAYIFNSSSTGWTQEEKLVADVSFAGLEFGIEAQIKDNRAFIGSRDSSGGLYVFDSGSSGWTQTFFLTASTSTYAAKIISYGDNILASGAPSGADIWTFSPFRTNPDAVEASRALLQFPIDNIVTDRAANTIPASGSVSFYLNLSNAAHGETTPKDFELVVAPMAEAWTEGFGLDMEKYKDTGPVNWISASATTVWNNPGGDFYSSPVYTSSFNQGDEDLNVDITPLVESWIDGTVVNNGIVVKLTPTFESSSTDSFYTKRFFGRRSEHFFKLPWIEARFDDSIKDNRNSFYVSSSFVPAADNLMKLFLYNRTRKGLKNIPAVGTGSIYVSLFSGTLAPTGSELTLSTGATSVTGGYSEAGIYSASVAIDTQHKWLFDVWHNNLTGASRVEYFTGSVINTIQFSGSSQFEIDDYALNITNMKPQYSTTETARFRVFTRLKNWSPTIYNLAVADIENETIEDAYYKIFRVTDDFDVIPYGTGSDNHTLLSYDKEGNYFDIDMSTFERDYQYGIQFVFKLEDKYYEQEEVFKFRVK